MDSKTGRKIVLAVDDVTMNLMVIKNLLSEHFDVRVAKSGEIALFILGSVNVDLILLDIEMPGMSGFDFINKLRELPNMENIPIIFVTSHSSQDLLNNAIRAGAADFIVKPVNSKLLKDKVFKALNVRVP